MVFMNLKTFRGEIALLSIRQGALATEQRNTLHIAIDALLGSEYGTVVIKRTDKPEIIWDMEPTV